MLGGLNLNPTGLPTEGTGAQKFMNQLGQNLQAGAAKAVIGTAINGGSLEGSLKNNLKTALLDTMAAQSANTIRDITAGDGTLDEFTNKVAHAIAGCAVGAARTDTSGGCGAGAIGAAVGEMAAEAYGRQTDTTAFAAMVSAIAAAATGASAAEINLASRAGGNAAANKYLSHDEQAMRKKAQAGCYCGSTASCTELAKLKNLDAQRDLRVKNLANDCTVDCVQVLFVNDELATLDAREAHWLGMTQHYGRRGRSQCQKPKLSSQALLRSTHYFAYSLARSGIKVVRDIASAGKDVPLVVADLMGSTPAAIAQKSTIFNEMAPLSHKYSKLSPKQQSSIHNAKARDVIFGRYIAGNAELYEAFARTMKHATSQGLIGVPRKV